MSSSETINREELAKQFGNALIEHPDVMTECLSLLRLYHLNAHDLYYKYEAFVMSRPSGLRSKLSTMTIDSVKDFRTDLQRQQQTKTIASMGGATDRISSLSNDPKVAVGVKKVKGNLGDLEGLLGGFATPVRHVKTPNAPSSATVYDSSGDNRLTISGVNSTTPHRESPIPPTSSSYRPGPSQLASSTNNAFLATPINKDSMGLSVPSSPMSPSVTETFSSSKKIQPLNLYAGSQNLVETLNPHLPSFSSSGSKQHSKPRVELSSLIDSSDYNYRYMFEKISERSEALDDLIDDYAESIKEAYGLMELGDPHFISDESIYTVGRILSSATSSKVDKNSLKSSFHLQSSRLIGAGKRIALEFPEHKLRVRGGAPGVQGFPLYSGCCVCVKGRNGGGEKFVVEEILMSPPSLLMQSSASDLISYQYGPKLNGEPITIIIAAGPFTLNDSLSYEPLDTLIEKVTEEKPDVLLLIGPFVDSQHPAIKGCAVSQTPAEIFQNQISNRLQTVVENSSATVILLVPSIRDMVSQHMAFPQSMFEKEGLGIPKKIKVLPNPCIFCINEVSIALTSVDILFHLNQAQVFMRAEEADPDSEVNANAVMDTFAGYIRQVLNQRSFYPLFPPPEDLAEDVNLDVTHYSLLKLEQAPDILIFPSKLNKFSKIVDSSLVINPSQLARARSAGHFAKLIIHPTPKKDLEMALDAEDVLLEHQVWDRARSEIWKLR
ncbi:hypothetical protein L204_104629 [Cryptococcus depauperatus]